MAIRDQGVWNEIAGVLESGAIVPPGDWCPVRDLTFYPPAEQGGDWIDEIRAASADGRLEFRPSPAGGFVRLKPR